MITFREFRDSLSKDEKMEVMNVVRKGMNISDDFWDDFLSLCGNVDGMSALLGSPREKITGLGGEIKKFKAEIEKRDSGESAKKDKMIKTGDK